MTGELTTGKLKACGLGNKVKRISAPSNEWPWGSVDQQSALEAPHWLMGYRHGEVACPALGPPILFRREHHDHLAAFH
jgi:hypothetical protein